MISQNASLRLPWLTQAFGGSRKLRFVFSNHRAYFRLAIDEENDFRDLRSVPLV